MKIRIEIEGTLDEIGRRFWSLNPVITYFVALAVVVLSGLVLVGVITILQTVL